MASPGQGAERTWRFKLDDTTVLEVAAPQLRARRSRRSKLILGALVVTLTLAVAFAAGAAAEGTPSIGSDKADYAPGDAVALTGSGWAAGETVHVSVDDDQSDAWSYESDLTAADDSTVSDALTLPDVAGIYTVTATAPSGTASATFTATAPPPPPPPPDGSPSITSDKAEYNSGETVALSGSGWAAGEAVHVAVDDDQSDPWTHEADVTASGDGTIADSLTLPELAATYSVTASAPSGTATATFTAGAAEPSPPTADPTLSSDRDAYTPGAPVTLSGDGWTAGDTVSIAVDDDKGDAWEHSTDVTVAGDGSIAESFDLPGGLAATFTATATDSADRSAEATFTAAFASATVPYLVRFASGTSADRQAQILAAAGAESQSYIAPLRIHGVLLPGGDSLQASLDKLASYPAVAKIEPDREREAGGTPNDSNYGDQWSLPQIGWENVFGTVSPGGSARVAILDTGIDGSHPDLDGSVVPGTSILDGSNGLSDANGHGTAMAGIVAAETDNGQGVAGIGYAGVTVMPVVVLGADGTGQDSDIIEGVVYAADNGADVILMAFSNPGYSEMLQAAIDYAWENGAVLVAATGNDGSSSVTFPAGDRGVIGVSNTDQSDALNGSSNSGQTVFLGAPGTGIATTSAGGGYTSITGTSAAAAEVAAAAALIEASSGASNGVIVSRLAKNAEPAGTQEQTGNGRLNVDRAIADTSSDSLQPAGAAPVGSGGPYVGPYVAAAGQIQTFADAGLTLDRQTFERGDTVFARATAMSTNPNRAYRFAIFDPSGALRATSLCFTGLATNTHSYTITSGDLLSDSASWGYRIQEFAQAGVQTALQICLAGGPLNDTRNDPFQVAKAFAFTSAANRATCTTQFNCPANAVPTFTPGSTVFIRVLGYAQNNTNTNDKWIRPNNTTACLNDNGNDRPDSDGSGTLDTTYPLEASGETPTGAACPVLAGSDAGQWRLELRDGGGGTEELVDLNAFTLTAVRSTSTTVTCSPASVALAQPSTCTATVADTGSGTGSFPTGTVTFSATPAASGTFSATTCSLAQVGSTTTSSCQVTYTPSANPGTHTINASYGGSSSHSASSDPDGFALTVTQRSTSTAVECPSSLAINEGGSCTATVTDTDGGSQSDPEGSVDFSRTGPGDGTFSGGGSCNLVSDGAATFTSSCSLTYTPSAGAGNHVVRADYDEASSALHASSFGTDTIDVTKRATVTEVTCTPGSVVVNESTSCTARVDDTSPGTTSNPSGTVTFSRTGPAGSTGNFSPMTCTLEPVPSDPDSSRCISPVTYTPTAGAGTHTLTGTYGGSSLHEGSSDGFGLSVALRATQTSVTCGNPAQIGNAITCTAQVDDIETAGTKSPPTGQVNFTTDGSGTFTGNPCSLTPTDADSSSCSVTYSSSVVAVDEINAHYLGSDVHAPSDSAVGAMTVFYDPNAGFVTGGGWIMSPSCAHASGLTGKANFGFVSKYKKGATVPEGQTEFQFHAGNLNFHSQAYEWLVVAGARAQYKGTGTVNGASGYSFMLTAVDGQISGGGGQDKFRIKIWNAGGVVYDNKCGADDSFSSAESQAISGGSIVIHSK